jgi:hypothetical protein
MKDPHGVDVVSVYILKSWLMPYLNSKQCDNRYNGVAVLTQPDGTQLVRAFEGLSTGRVLYRIFEAVAYWNQYGERSVQVDSIMAKNQELSPHQTWNILSAYCEKQLPDPSKWVLKPHVDQYAIRFAARQAQQGIEAEATADESWRYDPNLVPVKGDK